MMDINLLSDIIGLAGNIILIGITIYTLLSYRKVKPNIYRLMKFKRKRPLILPKDFDELALVLYETIQVIISAKKIEVIIYTAILGFILIIINYLLKIFLL